MLLLPLPQFIAKYQGDWLPPNTEPAHGTRNVDFVLWTGDAQPPDERVKDKPDGQVPTLQAAPGLRIYLWADQALVVSRHDQAVGGFFYGPVPGSRTGLAIDPGGWQRVDW